MTIGHIKAKDFKGFQTIDLDLQGKSTVFFGIKVQTNPLEGAGIVLIDEIELHMHPTWQRIVPGVLRKTFPHI